MTVKFEYSASDVVVHRSKRNKGTIVLAVGDPGEGSQEVARLSFKEAKEIAQKLFDAATQTCAYCGDTLDNDGHCPNMKQAGEY